MPVLKRTAQSLLDIEEIGLYIGRRQHRPSVAAKIIRELKTQCDLLAKHPHMGTLKLSLGDEVRIFSHKRWVIVFRPLGEEKSGGIEVLRILDGARDFGALF